MPSVYHYNHSPNTPDQIEVLCEECGKWIVFTISNHKRYAMKSAHTLLFRIFIFLLLAASAATARAAGLDCARAASPIEKIICAPDSDLRRKDAALSDTYERLLAVLPEAQRAGLRAAQRNWLKTRDKCSTDTCINDSYMHRIGELRPQLLAIIAWQPDEVDQVAFEDLRAQVEAERKRAPEFPLENVIKRLQVSTKITRFNNEHERPDVGLAHFPIRRPKGVTPDEWRALQASKIDAGGENGAASYMLVDLDGDGLRDLVSKSISGRIGIDVSVLQRKGNRFIDDWSRGAGQGSLYWLASAGGYQTLDWIRLHSRVYALWKDHYYGVDNVYFIRPFTVIDKAPMLAVRYQYHLSISPESQSEFGEKPPKLNQKLQAVINQALLLESDPTPIGDTPSSVMKRTLFSAFNQNAAITEASSQPLCPIPASASESDREFYYHNGAGPNDTELVDDDIPIKAGNECYIGRLTDSFGMYEGKEGLLAGFEIRKPDSGEIRTLNINGTRKAIKVKSSMEPMPTVQRSDAD